MKKVILSATLGVLLFSCQKSETDTIVTSQFKPVYKAPATAPQATTREGDCFATTTTVTLLAGQTINSGNVTVTNDGTNVSVTYTTINGWNLSEIHLYIGEYELAPQTNSGNPQPGRFPIKVTFGAGVTTYTHTMPLTSLPPCYIVAAHAVVKNNSATGGGATQTGWGQGTGFPGNNWGMYFDYCNETCPM